jgi:hypothetical protein
MSKITTAVVLTLLFGAHIAFAQSVYPAYYQPNPTLQPTINTFGGSCVNINKDLSVGARGSDVLALQKFILSRNYPGGGSWMLTGYYGAATRAGVIDIQIDMHVPQTGILDGATRAALANFTCGQNYNQYNQQYNQSPSQQYPWSITQPWYNLPTGQAGNTSYTYGNYNGNCSTVYGASSCPPAQGQCGWYTVAGHNYFNDCGPSNPNGTIFPNYDGNNPYGNYGSVNAPTISNISGPNTINVNTTGTWIVSINNPYLPNGQAGGSNYSSINVDWGDTGSYLTSSGSQQVFGSQSATFTHAYEQSGTFTVRFTLTNAYGSNTSTITVQANGNGSNNTNGSPWISFITPNSGHVGSQITIIGNGFSGDNTVHFGNGGKMHVTSASGNYIYFTIPQYLSPCDVQTSSNVCAQYLQTVSAGQYQIYVTTNGVNSNSLTFTVQ